MSVARSQEAREKGIRQFLETLYGGEYADLWFTVVVAIRQDDGELDWKNRRVRHIRLTDKNISVLVTASDKPGREVFFTPVPRSAKGDPSAANAGVPRTIYADVDKSALPARTLVWLRGLGACLVRSGGVVLTEAGRELPRYHVHLPLDAGSATPAHHEVEQLNQALTKRLGGDSKTSVGVILRLPGTRNWKPENRDADGIGRLVCVETYASQRVSVPDAVSALRTELLSASEYQRASVAVLSAVSASDAFERHHGRTVKGLSGKRLVVKANQRFEAGNHDGRHKLAGGLWMSLLELGMTEAEVVGVALGDDSLVGDDESSPFLGCLAAQDKWTDTQIAADIVRVFGKSGRRQKSEEDKGNEQSGPLGIADRSDESSPARRNEKGRSLMEETSAISAASEKSFGTAYWDQQQKLLDLSEGKMPHLNFARFVADHCGHGLRYVTDVGWFKWDGVVWSPTGDDGAAYQAINEAQQVLMARGADSPGDATWCSLAASKLTNHYFRKAVVGEMAVLPELHTNVNVMDAKRHLLTFRNGTVDLRTGALLPHRPDDMLSRCAEVDYNPQADCPRWLQFIEEVFPDDAELQQYVQTLLGYCVTGETREHILVVFYGEKGRNGKTLIMRTLQNVFGMTLVRSVEFSMYENRGANHKPHDEEIAALRSANVIVANEGKQGVKMNTAMIKNHTGGDIIQARHLRKGVFQMDPKFTLVMITNHLPKFPANDWALWSRVKAVRFPVSFAGREDRTLKDTFRDKEAEGIAAWVVRGAVRYYSEGLRDAESVSKATEKYREGSDELLDSGMVGELFEYDENSRASRPDFNRLLRAWREANQCGPTEWTPKRVKELLLASGHDVQEENQGRIFKGIRLLNYVPTQGKSGSGGKGVHAEPGGSAVQTGQGTLDLEPEEDDLADVEPEELDI